MKQANEFEGNIFTNFLKKKILILKHNSKVATKVVFLKKLLLNLLEYSQKNTHSEVSF